MQQKPCELYAQKHKMIEYDLAEVVEKTKAHKGIFQDARLCYDRYAVCLQDHV